MSIILLFIKVDIVREWMTCIAPLRGTTGFLRFRCSSNSKDVCSAQRIYLLKTLMQKRYLVTGATRHRALLAAGAQARAFVHRRAQRADWLRQLGAELVTDDLQNFEGVSPALDGVKGAYFVHPIRPGIHQATTYSHKLRKQAGLNAIVNLLQISDGHEAKSYEAQGHLLAEQIFNWSGMPTAHLRPTLIAERALYFIPLMRTVHLNLPFGTGKHAPITAEDQARVIGAICLRHRNIKERSIHSMGKRVHFRR